MASRANFSQQALRNPELISSRNAAVTDARGLGIQTQGLRELQRDLKRLEPEVQKALRKDLKKAAGPVVTTAQGLVRSRSGDLASSIRSSATLRGVSVGSRLPYANVIHWGGSTGKGHRPGVAWSGSVLVRPALFLSRSIERHEDDIVEAVGDAVEQAALRTGWHR